MVTINIKFNTIETIANSSIENKTQAYLDACYLFEQQASRFANNSNSVSRNSAREVSLSFEKAKGGDCEYAVYAASIAAEVWLCKSWNNAD